MCFHNFNHNSNIAYIARICKNFNLRPHKAQLYIRGVCCNPRSISGASAWASETVRRAALPALDVQM